MSRPLVTIQKTSRQTPLPNVFTFPIRLDIIRFVHKNLRKNSRVPYAVSRGSGHQTSAESWGTGRAVARIPRVSGGGTHRSGQGAFGNMCRGGRMFAPTKVYRKWHVHVLKKIRRIAVRAAIAASGIPALVMARGHRCERIPEIPLVVPNTFEALKKTKDARRFLRDVGALADVNKVKFTIQKRAGKGKMRNRRWRARKGPLLVLSKPCNALKAVRNLQGVDVNYANNLNPLKLAPGGSPGRLIVWTEDAFNQLDEVLKIKQRMYQPNSKRVINSEEVQGIIRARIKKHKVRRSHRPQPLLRKYKIWRRAKFAKVLKKHPELLRKIPIMKRIHSVIKWKRLLANKISKDRKKGWRTAGLKRRGIPKGMTLPEYKKQKKEARAAKRTPKDKECFQKRIQRVKDMTSFEKAERERWFRGERPSKKYLEEKKKRKARITKRKVSLRRKAINKHEKRHKDQEKEARRVRGRKAYARKVKKEKKAAAQ